ncbi:transcriptional regulator STERILE APETALA [Magnolia sinica]|uniref:transcriptional regulator STERILE APETALA n=1 Tax=Magnolia sinica TaxID=86752 RepID=UPI0026596FE0|nr:transcriptional regulator STERILE APETALA [Magnolia sinica]
MSSSSSSRSASSEEEEEEGGGDGGVRDPTAVIGRIGEPSSSRMRSSNAVWPEPFVEALATQVAIDATATNGRLAAGPALVSVFQVCSTWRAVSRSELLWQNLTRRIWARDRPLRATWREEYVHRHRTAQNFRFRRVVHTPLVFDASPSDPADSLSCRCLALSDRHVACGFLDGSVRLFDLRTTRHVSTLRPQIRDQLGRFSRAVSGIVLHGPRVVFASLDGDVHVANIRDPAPRRAHFGDVVNDGALVNFTGCSRWWVGLYAGVPGRAFHVWDSRTEELVFVGGSLTDPDAVQGWHLLTEMTESVGRVRVSSRDTGVACTGRRVMVFDLRNQGLVLGEEEFEQGVIVDSVDVSNNLFLVIDNTGQARVRQVRTFEQVCQFGIRGAGRVLGCMNGGYAFVYAGGTIRAWDIERGQLLYRLRERIGDAVDLVADEEHVAGCSSDTGIHLWRFSAV